jgi:hypothetical protein
MPKMKSNTKRAREFVKERCADCKEEYVAPKKIYGSGLIGGGLCETCLKKKFPARTAICPACKKPFHIQAGHQRQNCSRTCQKVLTLQRKSVDVVNVARESSELAARMLREKLEADHAEEERKANEATRLQSAKSATDETSEKQREAIEAVIKEENAKPGSRLERLGRIGGRLRGIRSEPAPVTV